MAGRNQRSPLKALFIGNSFTARNDLPNLVAQLAALTATAHKLARIVYVALKHGLPYVRKSQEEYQAQMKDKQIKALQRKARQLGLELIEKPSAGGATAEAPVQG
jgi:hypothetical protein